MFAFGNAATGFADLATEVDGVSQELTTALHSLADQEGGDISAHKAFIAHVIAGSNELAMSMMETSKACELQDGYDRDLAQAPTQRQVDLAAACARDMRALALAGHGSMQQAELAAAVAAEKAEQRQEALDAHEAATSGTHFDVPESTKWTPPSVETDDDSSGEKGDDPWSDEDSQYTGEDEDKKKADEPSSTDAPVDQPSDTPPAPTPLQPTTAEPSVRIADSPEFRQWLANQQPDAPAASTTLSSSEGPSLSSTTTPAYSTTLPQPQPIQNAPTVASPSWMQQPTPPPTGPSSANQLRPYGTPNPQNHPAARTRDAEEARQVPLDGTAAVMATQSPVVTSSPMPVSSPTPSTAPATPTTPPMGQIPPGQSPTSAGQAPGGPVGTAPVGPGGQSQNKSKDAASPKLELPDAMKRDMSPIDIAVMETLMGIKRPEDAARDARAAMAEQSLNPHVGAPR